MYAAAVIVVLLSPVSPSAAVAWLTGVLRDDLGWSAVRQGWVEFGLNIALFAPLGLLVTMLFRRVWLGVVTALALSVAAEAVQEFLPGRLASLRDVLANVVGAAIGALIAWIILRRLRGGAAPRSEKP